MTSTFKYPIPEEIKTSVQQYEQQEKKIKPQTMKDIKSVLAIEGEKWRNENSRTVQKGPNKGDVKIPPIPSHKMAAIVSKHVIFKMIGRERQRSSLNYYNVDEGVYESDVLEIHALIRCVDHRGNDTTWDSVIDHLKVISPVVLPFEDKNLMPVHNGMFNLKTKETLPFDPKYPIVSKIRTKPNPNAPGKLYDDEGNLLFCVETAMSEWAVKDEELITLLWQIINEATNPYYTRKKMVFLVGDGANGKGTFEQLIKHLVGDKNFAALRPSDYSERFRTEFLVGKVVNIGDDADDEHLKRPGDLMSVVTGDPIMVEKKHGGTYVTELKLLNIFSMNSLPSSSNKSYGWYRRLLLVPFNADFSGRKEDPKIKEEYLKHPDILEYVLHKALNLKFDRFIEPKASQKLLNEYKNVNDFMRQFVVEAYIEEGYHKIEKVPNGFIRQRLDDYLTSQRHKHTPIPNDFGTQLAKLLTEETEGTYEYKTTRFSETFYNQLTQGMKLSVKRGANVYGVVKVK